MSHSLELSMSAQNVYRSFLFFFFQAEDGIRDHCVTGVQTCALPICPSCAPGDRSSVPVVTTSAVGRTAHATSCSPAAASAPSRSEERRVGKECRSGWWANHTKKKEKRRTG